MPNTLNQPVMLSYDTTLDPGHYSKISTAFMRDPRYPVTVKALYVLLLGYAVQFVVVEPGQARLCKELAISEKTLRAAIDVLEKAGLLAVRRRGQGLTNVYKVYFIPLINNFGDKGDQSTHASRSKAVAEKQDLESKINKKDSMGYNNEKKPLSAGEAGAMAYFRRHNLLDTAII
jgi:hypothetical protein